MLNDEVINFTFKLFERRAKVEARSLPKCHFMNTLFYEKLANTPAGFKYDNVRRWTKRRDRRLFDYDMVIVPVHINGNHWTLAVINLEKQRFEYFDSLAWHERCPRQLA